MKDESEALVASTQVRLNLGAGDSVIDGYEARDGAKGDSLFPLPDADGSVDEIRASHVLEHFSHNQVSAILNHWVSKLKPGGRIRIAVPDFKKIAEDYLANRPTNIQGYVMGGQIDDRDYHKCCFDEDVLIDLMIVAGLERIHRWKSEITDAAALPVSLNLGAFKPLSPVKQCLDTVGVLSAPRFGPIMHFRFVARALAKAGVRYQIAGGAYWHQVLCQIMEDQIADPSVRYVVTCDYDAICGPAEVLQLYRLMEAYPQADAIVPLQCKRGAETVLFTMRDAKGDLVDTIAGYQFDQNLLPISTGHFGLTIFRADSLRTFSRPWMVPVPNEDGQWIEGKTDADIDFWRRWHDAGKSVFLAPRVVVGHLQEMITWPDRDLKPVYQTEPDYDTNGMPEEARR